MKFVRWLLAGLMIVIPIVTAVAAVTVASRGATGIPAAPNVTVIDSTGSTLSPEDKTEIGERAGRVGSVVYVANAPAWSPGERPGTTILVNLVERTVTVGSDTLPRDVTDSAETPVDTTARAAIDQSLDVIEKYYDGVDARKNNAWAITILFVGGILMFTVAKLYLRLVDRDGEG